MHNPIKRLAASVLTLSLAAGAAAAANDCVLHYGFDQTNGTTVTDLSGTGHDGILHATAIDAGVNGQGVYLNGAGACVTIPLSDRLRGLTNAITVECWVSPEAATFASLLWAADNADTDPFHKVPLRFEWRGPSWKFWFAVTAADGEVRLAQPPDNTVPELTFPVPTWYHVVGTYDGQTVATYVNGHITASATFPARKPFLAINEPIFLGSSNLRGCCFRGRMDEFRIFDRALTAAEVLSAYERKTAFTPAAAPKAMAGTLDGKPYVPATLYTSWVRCSLNPPELGTVHFSNSGELDLIAGQSPMHTEVMTCHSLPGQTNREASFYREVSGQVRLHPPGQENSLELDGIAYDGRRIHQDVVITSNNEIRVRYDVSVTNGTVAPVVVAWPMVIQSVAAVSFVGTENGRRVSGRLMDLARTAVFEDTAEVTLSRGGCRLIVRPAAGAVWQFDGTRDLATWVDGYAHMSSQIRNRLAPAADAHTSSLTYSLQITDDMTPPLLNAQGAEEITPDVPFDFSNLKETWPGNAVITLINHEVPIYGLDESIAAEFRMTNINPQASSPAYEIRVEDAFSNTTVHTANGIVSNPCSAWVGRLSLKSLPPGVYNVSVRFTDAAGQALGAGTRELVVAGPIPQPVRRPNERLKLVLVDSADLTLKDPGHDYYSCAGQSPVVRTHGVMYRELLGMNDRQLQGTGRRDFVGAKLVMRHPTEDHVVEVVYADLDDTIVGVQVYEPVPNAASDPRPCVTRVGAGIITGGVFPHDGKLKRMTTEYFPSGTQGWCAVACVNLYTPAAGVARINLYEVKGGLPRLPPLPSDRLIGVHTESGNVSIGSFGYGPIVGEQAFDCPRESFYREHYRAIANMIRCLRFRGENMYDFGVYRYRAANFPSKHVGFSPPSRSLDLPALMAKMFEYNDLKMVLNVAPMEPMNIARHYRRSTWDAIQGLAEPRQMSCDGRLDAGLFVLQPANPFHPVIQDEYAKYTDELGERYGGMKSFAGVSWLYGAAGIGEPCVYNPFMTGIRKDDTNGMNNLFFRYSYDDVTMDQFQRFAGVTLPGAPGDPKRFRQRYDWILANALEKWIDFRCDAMSRVHQRLAASLHQRAPTAKYYLMDYFGMAFQNEVSEMDPLDLVRRMGNDPRLFTNQSAVVYCPYVPTLDAGQFKEYAHGGSPREMAMKNAQFARSADFYTTCDTGADCARYLHRQFFETWVTRAPGRPWIFKADRNDNLGLFTYPQPAGANWMADFAIMLAYATPNLITWMWTDGLFPTGQYEEMQSFALAYRQLPLGTYRTIKHDGSVFVRAADRAFYVVETGGTSAICRLPASLAGTYKDVVSGKTLRIGSSGKSLDLTPYALRVFVAK